MLPSLSVELSVKVAVSVLVVKLKFATGGVLLVPGESSHTERPKVAARTSESSDATNRSVVFTSGRPVPKRAQGVPPSLERYTPRCVAANSVVVRCGSTITWFTGMPVGKPPASIAVQLAPKLVEFQAWFLVESGATEVMKIVLLLE